MNTTATQRRKPPLFPEIEHGGGTPTAAVSPSSANAVQIATVRRRRFGTSPFDEHWLNLDCCGLFCACITYSLHLYAIYTVCVIMIPPWMSELAEDGTRIITTTGKVHTTLFVIIASLACLSHFKAMTTDPGAVPPDAKPLPAAEEEAKADEEAGKRKKGLRLCRRCNAFKPHRAHHCSVCRRCIIKMDHHCPWVNNCVGIGNHKYFLLFVFYTLLSCLYTIGLLVAWFTICMNKKGSHRGRDIGCLAKPSHLLNLLGLIVEAVLFGMFTSCMIVDQTDVISSKMTHIDRLKGGGDVGAPSLAGVAEVFGAGRNHGTNAGTRFRPDWLSPFAKVCFPASVRDDVMGFCRPCLSVVGQDNTTELAPLKGSVRSVTEIA